MKRIYVPAIIATGLFFLVSCSQNGTTAAQPSGDVAISAEKAVTAEPMDSYSQQILKRWTAKGMDIKTGAEADGSQNLVVFAQEAFSERNGYFPLESTAKAGVKSILRVYTNRTMGCSRAFNLPDLNISAILPATGVKEFAIPAMPKGSRLYGVCGMGMYSFEIDFK